MARFFLPPDAWAEHAVLTGDEARHLAQVLRIPVGGRIEVFDGKGRRAAAAVCEVSRDRVGVQLGTVGRAGEISPSLVLAQAIPKGKNMDLIVQKAVELGVCGIQPLITRNTVVQPGEGKAEKWRRNALEACKQCGQDTLPDIHEPLAFETWLAGQQGEKGMKLIASLAPGAKSMKEVLRAGAEVSRVMILVGPEGDFTPRETELALTAGFVPISLGGIVLRVETAALFCLSALRYEFGAPS